jgi:branched-chain amino acid transport system substrate-binding protein
MKMKRSIVLMAMMMALGAAIFAGCGGGGSSSSGGGGTEAESGEEAEPEGGETANASDEEGGEGEPFTVLVDVDQTGPTKVYGLPELAGVEGAAKALNEEGGILGHEVVVENINDNGNPQTGSSELVKWLGSHDKPNSFYPGAESTLEGALIPIATREELFISGKGDGSNLYEKEAHKNYPLAFQIQGGLQPFQEAIADWFEKEGIKNVGIVQGEYAYAEGEIPIIEEILDEKGIKHETVKADLEATSYTPQLDQLKSEGAEGLYVALVEPASNHIFGSRAELGWDVPIVGENSFAGADYTKTVPASQLKNAYYIVDPNVPTNTKVAGVPKLKEIVGVPNLEKFGVPFNVVSLGWDTLIVDKYAAEAANSIEPKAMAEALEQAGEWEDPLLATWPSIKFTEEDHQNQAITPEILPIIPVGPYKAGQVAVK